jgi:hypothetical protein
MKQFTIADIRKWNPCYDPSKHLPETWQGTALDILNDNRIPFQDRLWVIMRKDLVSEKLMRQFVVWCARQVQRLMRDERSLHALEVAEAYAEYRWLINDADYVKAWEYELAAAGDAAWVAADVAIGIAAWDAARAAAWAAAGDAAVAVSAVARDGARVVAWTASQAAADFAARTAAQAAQEQKLREMLIEGIETGDTK